MKAGLSLTVELERRNNAKRDFVAGTASLIALPNGTGLEIAGATERVGLTLGETFKRQVETHYKIPADYASRIQREHPGLYATTLNTFFTRQPARRMVRTLDGRARAFLSDRYRPLDDFDLAQAVLPEILKHDSIRIESTQFTESRFYMKAVFPKIEAEVVVGDPVQIGLIISNSEVGNGALSVQPLVYRLVCKNGMVANDYGQRRYHVGRKAEGEGDAFELYSDDTRRVDDTAFFMKVRDTVVGVLKRDVLERIVTRMQEARQQGIGSTDIPAVVEVLAKRNTYSDSTKNGILRHLIEGRDLSRYGLMNAITRQSQDEGDYEVATKLEMDGGRLIELPQNDWRAISEAQLKKAA